MCLQKAQIRKCSSTNASIKYSVDDASLIHRLESHNHLPRANLKHLRRRSDGRAGPGCCQAEQDGTHRPHVAPKTPHLLDHRRFNQAASAAQDSPGGAAPSAQEDKKVNIVHFQLLIERGGQIQSPLPGRKRFHQVNETPGESVYLEDRKPGLDTALDAHP